MIGLKFDISLNLVGSYVFFALVLHINRRSLPMQCCFCRFTVPVSAM